VIDEVKIDGEPTQLTATAKKTPWLVVGNVEGGGYHGSDAYAVRLHESGRSNVSYRPATNIIHSGGKTTYYVVSMCAAILRPEMNPLVRFPPPSPGVDHPDLAPLGYSHLVCGYDRYVGVARCNINPHHVVLENKQTNVTRDACAQRLWSTLVRTNEKKPLTGTEDEIDKQQTARFDSAAESITEHVCPTSHLSSTEPCIFVDFRQPKYRYAIDTIMTRINETQQQNEGQQQKQEEEEQRKKAEKQKQKQKKKEEKQKQKQQQQQLTDFMKQQKKQQKEEERVKEQEHRLEQQKQLKDKTELCDSLQRAILRLWERINTLEKENEQLRAAKGVNVNQQSGGEKKNETEEQESGSSGSEKVLKEEKKRKREASDANKENEEEEEEEKKKKKKKKKQDKKEKMD